MVKTKITVLKFKGKFFMNWKLSQNNGILVKHRKFYFLLFPYLNLKIETSLNLLFNE